jgi:S-adenosylmethionine hydrolase
VPASRPLIALLTDFGERDWFVASMKGVILTIHPNARVVDISHQIPSHQIDDASYVLGACYRHFPDGTIYVCVVDPGVGSTRRAILATTSRYSFLAPDNGLLSHVLEHEQDVIIRQIEEARYRLPSEGGTFDGRDLFAPVAALLASGEPPSFFGPVINDPMKSLVWAPQQQDQILIGRIEYIDRFGNLISNVTAKQVREFQATIGLAKIEIHIGTHIVTKLVGNYSQGDGESPAALINSGGFLEIFLQEESAARCLQVDVGQEVRLC